MSKVDNFGSKANTNGFKQNKQNIHKKTKSISFKKRYKDIIRKQEGVIWCKEDEVHTREVNGIKEIGFQLTSEDALIKRLDDLANGDNEKLALDVIKFLWEQFDGKARQGTDITIENDRPKFQGFDFLPGREEDKPKNN